MADQVKSLGTVAKATIRAAQHSGAVRHWRSRWLSGQAEAAAAARLADEPRPGAPATFTPEQVCAIVALACEPPEKSELPLSHWSQSERPASFLIPNETELAILAPCPCRDCARRVRD
jgi:hypothetical protein